MSKAQEVEEKQKLQEEQEQQQKKQEVAGEDEHHHGNPVGLGVRQYSSLDEMYKTLHQEIQSFLETAPKVPADMRNDYRLFTNLICSLSNISSVIFYAMNAQHTQGKDAMLHSLPINWCGFYLLDRPDRLTLSAFQGKLACTQIKLGKGMCGKAALMNKDLCIEDVHQEVGHIACDSASESEAVICLRDGGGRCVGVLDIDSAVKGRFTDAVDRAPLRKITDLITKFHEEELAALFRGATAKKNQQEQQLQDPMQATAALGGGASASVSAAVRPGAAFALQQQGQQQIQQVQFPPSSRTRPPVNLSRSSPGMSGQSQIINASPQQQQRQDQQQQQQQQNASSSSSAAETGDLKRHKDWELRYRCVQEMLKSSAMDELGDRLQVKQLPEIIFDLNEIHFVMDDKIGGGNVKQPIKFRVCALSALTNVTEYVKTEEYEVQKELLFPNVKENAHWAAKRSTMTTFDPKVDWAFRNNYRGIWHDGSGESIKTRKAEPSEEDERIDYDLLKQTNLPILFFASIDLFEDDLHDNGISKILAKARVMDPCMFVLVRHVLRVDGVKMQVRDARHFHKFGTKKIIIEETIKSIDIPVYLKERRSLTSEDFHRTLMTTPVEQLDMLKEDWRQVSIIDL